MNGADVDSLRNGREYRVSFDVSCVYDVDRAKYRFEIRGWPEYSLTDSQARAAVDIQETGPRWSMP